MSNGTLLLVAGLSIVRVHNHWTTRWPILVTIIGWCVLLAGLGRMIAPVSSQQAGQYTTAVLALTFVLLVIGIFLTVEAYRREEKIAGNRNWSRPHFAAVGVSPLKIRAFQNGHP